MQAVGQSKIIPHSPMHCGSASTFSTFHRNQNKEKSIEILVYNVYNIEIQNSI